MRSFIDPRNGDIETDASSPKSQSLIAMAGTLLAEISPAKAIVAWLMLVALPALSLGAAPIAAAYAINVVALKLSNLYLGLGSAILLFLVLGLAFLGGRRMFLIAESNFWTLNSIAVQPVYAITREALSQFSESLLHPGDSPQRRATWRSATALASGTLISAISGAVLFFTWPYVAFTIDLPTLLSIPDITRTVLANSIAIVAGYVALAALVWAFDDWTAPPPLTLTNFAAAPAPGQRAWRIAHLSDIHVVGERYGYRIESGRKGPRGNVRLSAAFERLKEMDAHQPLDAILITGDITDAGVSPEWAEFYDIVGAYENLADRILIIPGNHDLNIVDRANPARIDLPTSPYKRLRKVRMLCAMDALQGQRVHVVSRPEQGLGATLSHVLMQHESELVAFKETGRLRHSRNLSKLWTDTFPLVHPPGREDGLGIMLFNSTPDTHFSFTNALGLVSADQLRGAEIAMARYPRANWILALHHHAVEYPQAAKALSERIGTVLINGNWLLRKLQPHAHRIVVMHGHRHIDWKGRCGNLLVLSAPSVVMEATNEVSSYFYVHTFSRGTDGSLVCHAPEKIVIDGEPQTSSCPVAGVVSS